MGIFSYLHCEMGLVFVQCYKSIHFSKNHLTNATESGKIVRLSARRAPPIVSIQKNEKIQTFFKKGIDKGKRVWYNSQAAAKKGSERSLKIEQQREKYKA